MVDVLTDLKIGAPRDDVAAYAGNPDNATEWYVNIKEVEWKTDRAVKVGSKVAFKAHFLGRKLAYIYEIVEYDPGKKMVMKTADGPFPMETTYTWEEDGPGLTRMTLRNRGVPSGFSKVITPFMAMMMKRANKKDLEKVKEIMEKK
ncbi:ATPase [Filobacillus milosensis]|uniref:ATPase n=1 Tax=Filobacillus milosensis TaxID=94137 RepID=A0A4Y8IJW7_9BACI|nr:SRPBCC family protein [Filobacillus milosensis]TFB19594.1 ATPase [Filobacillus milosensis]